MIVELPAEELYAVIQAVGNYVLTGEECDCDTLVSRVVCNQLISTIDRKGQKAVNSAKNLPDKKKKEPKEVKQAQAIAPQENKQEDLQPAPEPTKDDDTLFEDFFYDRSMDYSSLLTNVSYFKERKKDELNRLYQNLGKRYSGDQIIQILQKKWAERISK